MSQVLIGCGPFVTGNAAPFRCGEVLDALQEPVRHNTLRRWATNAPAGFQFFIGAWRWLGLEPLDEKKAPPLDFHKRTFGLLQTTDANRAIWAEVDAQARAASARGVLIRTPPAFSPSPAHLDDLRRFRAEVIADAPYEIVWEPRGVWQHEELATIAADLRLTIAVDPHVYAHFPEPIDGDAYYTVTAPPGRVRFSEDDVLDLVEFARAHEGLVRVVFRGPDRETNARAFAKAIDA